VRPKAPVPALGVRLTDASAPSAPTEHGKTCPGGCAPGACVVTTFRAVSGQAGRRLCDWTAEKVRAGVRSRHVTSRGVADGVGFRTDPRPCGLAEGLLRSANSRLPQLAFSCAIRRLPSGRRCGSAPGGEAHQFPCGAECRPGSAPMCGDWVRLMVSGGPACVAVADRLDDRARCHRMGGPRRRVNVLRGVPHPRGAAGALRRSRGGARTDCERCRRRFEDGPSRRGPRLDRGRRRGLICPGCQTYEDRSWTIPHGDRTLELDSPAAEPDLE